MPAAESPDIAFPVIGWRASWDAPASGALMLEEPRFGDGAAGEQEDVEVGDRHREQRVPGELRVVHVDLRDPGPELVAHRVLGEVPQPATDRVAARVAGERVEPDEGDVDHEDQRAQ